MMAQPAAITSAPRDPSTIWWRVWTAMWCRQIGDSDIVTATAFAVAHGSPRHQQLSAWPFSQFHLVE